MRQQCATAEDSVGRLADRIADRFVGERVTCCDVRRPDIGGLRLAGQRLVGIDVVNGHLLLHFEDTTVCEHLRVDGRWLVGPQATEPAWRRQLELRLETGWLTELDVTGLHAAAPPTPQWFSRRCR